MTQPKVLIHLQTLLGAGHLVRMAAILDALMTQGNMEVHLVTGNLPHPHITLPCSVHHQLPPCRARDETFRELIDERGNPIDDAWMQNRARKLMDIYNQVRPDAIVTEMFPFGRHKLAFELLPMLEAAKTEAIPAKIISSVRDILVRKKDPAKSQDSKTYCEKFYDLVLVHGDEEFVPFDHSFPLAKRLGPFVIHTGYVTDAKRYQPNGHDPYDVIVSVGSGVTGRKLIQTALDAIPHTKFKQAHWLFLTGQEMPDLCLPNPKKTQASITVKTFDNALPSHLSQAQLSVSQGGYNTLTEVLKAKVRSVVVPFSTPSETEQVARAVLLQNAKYIQYVDPKNINEKTLAKAINKAATMKRNPPPFDTDGAQRSARFIGAEATEIHRLRSA